jgi:hypothetical protein
MRPRSDIVALHTAGELAAHHADLMFGPPPDGRRVRIMVTVPSAAAADASVIPVLLAYGMDVMRIACADGHPGLWTQMLRDLDDAGRRLGKTCPVCFDVADTSRWSSGSGGAVDGRPAWGRADRRALFTEKDLVDLHFAVRNRGIVALSTLRHREDLDEFHRESTRLGSSGTGTIVSVDTESGVLLLPQLLLAAVRRPPVAVEIRAARLAAAFGDDRLSGVHEEIARACEAARVPVIETRRPRRDAGRWSDDDSTEAFAVQPECVMLEAASSIRETVMNLRDLQRALQLSEARRALAQRRLHLVRSNPTPWLA